MVVSHSVLNTLDTFVHFTFEFGEVGGYAADFMSNDFHVCVSGSTRWSLPLVTLDRLTVYVNKVAFQFVAPALSQR